MGISQWFMNGGQFMYFILVANIMAVGCVISAAVCCGKPAKKMLDRMTMIVSSLPMLLGALGSYTGYVTAIEAISMADPQMKQELYDASMSLAMIPSVFGILSSVLLLVVWYLSHRLCHSQSRY